MKTLRACGKVVASGTTLIAASGTAQQLFWVYATGKIVLTKDSKTVGAVTDAGDLTATHATLAAVGVLYLKTAAGNIYQVQEVVAATEIMTLKTAAVASETTNNFTLFCRYDCRAIILTSVTGSGVIWIGDSTVDHNALLGFRLNTADPPFILPLSGMADIWVDADTTNNKVAWVCIA